VWCTGTDNTPGTEQHNKQLLLFQHSQTWLLPAVHLLPLLLQVCAWHKPPGNLKLRLRLLLQMQLLLLQRPKALLLPASNGS
jgi:hypothetical protein